jgi:thiol:disulfide interchange protein
MRCLPAFALVAAAMAQDPVQWTLDVEQAQAPPGGIVLARLTATIDAGWHLYSTTTPPGPIPTTILLAVNDRVASAKLYQPKPVVKFDPNFNSDAEFYDNRAVFLIAVNLAASAERGPTELVATARYQVCSDKICLRPVRKSAKATLTISTAAPTPSILIPDGYTEVRLSSPPAAAPAKAESAAPARDAAPAPRVSADSGWRLPAIAFGFGLAAIITPCVFPMIPITMSFFLSRKSGDALFQAAVFCLGIVVLFTGLGLVTTAILGPFGVVQLGANVWVNAFIAAVFLIFALSLLGAFEITLPSGLLTQLDAASRRGGLGGTLLMGLTFSLTSFACVGPFVGTLLAASVQEGGWRPAIGMASFATGLAFPFFFLALFPAGLKRLPKSGGWMSRVKVVLGFVILAAMLKYFSNVDKVLRWEILTRERFLAAWVVLFALAGLYLLGLLRMQGIRGDEELGVGRALTGAAFLVFALSLVPGMFGGRLGEIDAYVPPPSGGYGAGAGGAPGQAWIKDNYKEALARAREQNKLVFINFTGYTCTNCHWMKANMFPRPEIAAALGGYILAELYTDGTDAVSEENARLQETKFRSVAIPYYAIVDPQEKVIAKFEGLTRNTKEFLDFLRSPERLPAASNGAL